MVKIRWSGSSKLLAKKVVLMSRIENLHNNRHTVINKHASCHVFNTVGQLML